MNNSREAQNRRVLVIDDNRGIHHDFRKIFSQGTAAPAIFRATDEAIFGPGSTAPEAAPFEMDSAYQGPEGLEMVVGKLKTGVPYAVAFVDVRMPPGWDGIETSTRIRQADPEV